MAAVFGTSSNALLGLSCLAGAAAFHAPSPQMQLSSSGPSRSASSPWLNGRRGLAIQGGRVHCRGERRGFALLEMQRKPNDSMSEADLFKGAAGICAKGEALLEEKCEEFVCSPQGVCVIPENEDAFEVDKIIKPAQVWITRVQVLLVAFLYGTNFGVVKLMGEEIPVSMAAALRFTLAVIALSPLLAQVRKEVIPQGLEIGFWVTLGYIVQAVGLETVEASKMGFLCALIVVVCPVLEAVSGGKISKGQWYSVAVAVVGAGFLELGGTVRPAIGDLFGLVQPVGFGVALWKCEQVQREYPDQGGAITALQLVVTMFASWLWVIWDNQGLPSVESITGALNSAEMGAAVLWTGLITTALTVFLQTTSVSKLSSQEATVLISTEPIWAALFSSVLLQEVIGPNAFIGGGLIVGACIFSIFADSMLDGVEVEPEGGK